jgi:hypothetical protein
MPRVCEICANLDPATQPAAAGARRLRRVLVEDRLVCLCEMHAVLFRASGKSTLEELRALFTEPSGRRSLLGRRAPLDRRVFPPRPEGRRSNAGRRDPDRTI